jgi:hypothetical protein
MSSAPAPPPRREPSLAEKLPTYRRGDVPNTQADINAAAKTFAEAKSAVKAASDAKRATLVAQNTGFGPGEAYPIIRTNGGRTRRRFKKKRLMSRKYCKKTPCRRMGFTQKASCRPYKNCYTRRR